MIKIVSPITSINEVDPLVDAGASELYCGVMTQEESISFTNIYCLNRRPSVFSNLMSFRELVKLVKIAKNRKVKVSFTLNEFYNEEQFVNVREQIERAIDSGVDALIVADLGVIEELQRYRDEVKIYVGVGGTVFNSKAIEFYKKMGITRVILPRHLTVDEINNICSEKKDIELECLILNERCHYIDGFCNHVHSVFSYKNSLLNLLRYNRYWDRIRHFLSHKLVNAIHVYGMKKELACCFDYKVEKVDNAGIFIKNCGDILDNFFNIETFLNACGACALYELNKIGINSVKIVGRVFFKNKVKDVEFLDACIKLLKNETNVLDYKDAVKDIYRAYFNKYCKKSYCYYP